MKTLELNCQGYKLPADLYERPRDDEVILFLYGYSSNKLRQKELIEAIVDQTDATVFVFDYSGHGDAPFALEEIRPAQHFLEVITAFDWVKQQYPDAKITVIGGSYGGYQAVQLTKYRKFNRLILRAPAIYEPSSFYTLNGEINSDEGWALKAAFRKNVEALAKHPLLGRASNFSGKTLVIIHEKDEVIPTETTDAYIKAFSAEVYIAKGFPHALSDPSTPVKKIPEYQKAISDWINKN